MDKANLKDHRQIGQELDLFSFHDVAPGAVFWHHKGWIIYKTLQEFIRNKLSKEGYQEISTPVMVKSALFKKSGHWEHFGEHNMFNLPIYEEEEIARLILNKELAEKEGYIKILKLNDGSPAIYPMVNYSLKPMNCPESTLVYSTRTRSYQDLPIKFSDYGILHRRELSGVLGGLFRVRQFTIDDAHLYVRPDQIQKEIHKLLILVVRFYKSLNFQPEFYFSTKPDKAMGDPKLWIEAEKDLEEALKNTKVKYNIKEKDGAFYGPKIDIHIKDSQNRDWQLATIQLDFQIPERMGLEYIDAEGKPKKPVMIHRAIFGSFERFIGILTEHYQGAFPLWLAPVQVVIMPITDKQEAHAKKLTEELKAQGIRAELDNRPERLQAKIRDGSLQKVPYLGIIGDKEIKSARPPASSLAGEVGRGNISIRTREGKDLGQIKLSKFIIRLKEEIDKKI